jgi:hypothetical protein
MMPLLLEAFVHFVVVAGMFGTFRGQIADQEYGMVRYTPDLQSVQ